MAQWADVPWERELFLNADETVLSNSATAIENAFFNAGGGQSRFPGIKEFVTNLGGTKTYCFDWHGDLIAATDEGKVYRIRKDGTVTDVTGVPIRGGRRVIFARTEDRLLMAAGGQIISLSKSTTEILSKEAPESSHVAYVDGYIVAIEAFSGRFQHSDSFNITTWSPLDIFTAEGKPDDVTAVAVTPYRELLLAGPDSIEQWERTQSGDQPFARRWVAGEGVSAPYTLVCLKTGNYGVSPTREFVRFAAQVSQPQGDEIYSALEKIDDWTDAWADAFNIAGQRFIVLQAPFATSIYGTKGVTFLLDYRAKRWTSLYGWDQASGLPTRWRPWSYRRLWDRHFVGIPGGVGELDVNTFDDLGDPMRMLGRTGHIDKWGNSRIDKIRCRFKRGVGQRNASAKVGLRINKDNRGFGPMVIRELGEVGDTFLYVEFPACGIANSWQFEYFVTDPAAVEFSGMQVLVEPARI